jgi:hypothetical protein
MVRCDIIERGYPVGKLAQPGRCQDLVSSDLRVRRDAFGRDLPVACDDAGNVCAVAVIIFCRMRSGWAA